MAVFDLTNLDWTVEAWRPYSWRLGRSMETNVQFAADVGPFPADAPGTVQQTLIREGVIPDWYEGVHSRDAEWAENRHWIFEAWIPEDAVPKGEPVQLRALGLDYGGWIQIDRKDVAEFSGALIPHEIDLTEHLSDGKSHLLGIVFDEPPAEQGQIGYSNRSKFFKPRYSYSWDWVPRMVPIGITDRLFLVSGVTIGFQVEHVQSDLDEDNKTGRVVAKVAATSAAAEITATVSDGGKAIKETTMPADEGTVTLVLGGLTVEPWWPNGMGPTKTYTLELAAKDASGSVIWSESRPVGFKRIEWQPCEGAPEEAEPWICVVNGKPVFLQGANWVPPCASYPDSKEQDYCDLLTLYRDMGCNLLRVWGGGILETESFYRLCDEFGILVWQEFPLSSSGINNAPPRDLAAISKLVDISASYIQRRCHHVSLLMWCGGNELMERRTTNGPEVPVDYDHPCIAAMKAVVARNDPSRRFVPSSPSGPAFYAHPDNYGKGVHHDTHGPWGLGPANGGFKTLDDWRQYWEGDDSLLRSEVGMPAAATREQFDRYHGGMPVWPVTNEYWRHSSSWWLQWDRYGEQLKDLDDEAALNEYIRLTQEVQAEAYAIAASTSKNRFPKCGGFFIWMGHDCFPCAANNSVIDFMRNPKPAYYALKKVYTGKE